MKKILVPTDFSENANNALEYAVNIAKKTGAKILILHVYSIGVVNTDSPEYLVQELLENRKNIVEKQLNLLAETIKKRHEINCKTLSSVGFVTEEVIDITEKNKINLIVMGTKGASGLKEILLGSNAAMIIEKSLCPVIAIPQKSKWKSIKNILYATDFNENELNNINELIGFAELFNAKLTLAHIAEKNENLSGKKDPSGDLMSRIQQNFEYVDLKIISAKDDSVMSGLNNMINYLKPDMLAMATYRRGIIAKIFKRSLTKKMAYHINLPLLALHKKI